MAHKSTGNIGQDEIKNNGMEVDATEGDIHFNSAPSEHPQNSRTSYRTFDEGHQNWLKAAQKPPKARPPAAPNEHLPPDQLPIPITPATPDSLLMAGPAFQTTIILISGVLVNKFSEEAYLAIHIHLGQRFGLRPDFDAMELWWKDNAEERLFYDEPLGNEPLSATCSFPAFIEPEYFSAIGEGLAEWPQLFRLSIENPGFPQLKKWMWAQAVPTNFGEYISSHEIAAYRGIPVDSTGAAAGMCLSALQHYIRGATTAPTITLISPRSLKVETSRKGNPIEEPYMLVYAHKDTNRVPILHDLKLNSLGSMRATQHLGLWMLQVATSYGTLCEAHPGPITTEYYILRILGYALGVPARAAVAALLSNPENRVGNVFFIYPDRYFLRETRPPGLGDSDHLVCIYPTGVDPPTVFPNADTQLHLRSMSLWRTAGAGQIVPGWDRVLTFYRWLAKEGSCLERMNQMDRQTKAHSSTALVRSDTQIMDQRVLDQRLSTLERRLEQAPTNASVTTLFNKSGAAIIYGMVKDQVATQIVPIQQTVDRGVHQVEVLRDGHHSLCQTVVQMQSQMAGQMALNQALEDSVTNTRVQLEKHLALTSAIDDRLRSMEQWTSLRSQEMDAMADGQERILSRLERLEQLKARALGEKRPLALTGPGGGDPGS